MRFLCNFCWLSRLLLQFIGSSSLPNYSWLIASFSCQAKYHFSLAKIAMTLENENAVHSPRFHYKLFVLISSTQITNTEIFAFISALVFKILKRKFCLQTEKAIETIKKKGTFSENSKFHG